MARFKGIAIPPGEHVSPDGIVYATPDRIRRWADRFRKMRERGIRIPVAWGHGPDSLPVESEAEFQRSLAQHNAGYLLDLYEDPETGGLAFEAEAPGVEHDPDTKSLTYWTRLPTGQEVKGSIAEVSAGINSWQDGTGQLWPDSVIHLALTPLPVCAGQQGFLALSSLRRRPSSSCACVGPNCPSGAGRIVGRPLRLSTLSVSPVAVPPGGLHYGTKRLPGGYRLSLWQLGTLEERAERGDRDAEAILIRLGWTKGRSRSGRSVWIGNAEDAGKRRYQESEPGSWTRRRQAKAQYVQGWHGLTSHGEFAQRLQEAHGEVLPEEEASESDVNRAYATLKKHHYRGGDPLGRLVLRLREKAGEYAHQAQDEEATPTSRWLARRKLHGIAQMLQRALAESGGGQREGLLETPGGPGAPAGEAVKAAEGLRKKEEPKRPLPLPRARMKQAREEPVSATEQISPGDQIEVMHSTAMVGGGQTKPVARTVRVDAVDDAEGGGQVGRFRYTDEKGRERIGYFNTRTSQWKRVDEEKPLAPGDVLPGGKADTLPPGTFSPEKEAEGAAVEREHTSNPEVAAEIARDHLSEDPNYYDKLKAVEGGEGATPGEEAGAPTPPDPHFTGTLTDSLGRVYHFVDGKRVKSPEEVSGERLERTGEGGAGGGLPAGQPVGEDAGAPSEAPLPRSGEATRGGPEGLPSGADVVGDAAGRAPGGAGERPAGGPGGGPREAAAGAGGGAGPADALRPGRGDGERPGGGGARAAEESLAEPPSPENPTDVAGTDWSYHDTDFSRGGLKQKFRQNLEAIRTLKEIQAEGRTSATPEEQAILSRYVGWGQFPALFNDYYGYNDEWSGERSQLKALLTDEEWKAAKGSTLNAHYTHPDVVRAHWEMAQRLGFKGGRFLETSAGIGYYLGLMPPDVAGRTQSSAVELDRLTGSMLDLLYPRANVAVQGFQEHLAPDNFYDLIASNVPFGAYKVHDPRYNKHQANIHDYFFLKSADLAKPGGLVMHITSTGTLDKPDSKIRAELADKCELVAAIRFPGGAHKENAGTDVVTDMLILRKKIPGEQPVHPTETPTEAQPQDPGFTGVTTDSLGRLYHWVNGKRVPAPDWTKTTTVPDPAGGEPIPVNQYFSTFPEQILGTLDRTGTMYRGESVNVSKTDDYEDRLQAAIGRLPEGVLRTRAQTGKRFTPEVAPAPGQVKDGGYHVKDGKLFVREGGGMVEQKAPAATLERIQAMLGVRDALRALINDQLQGRDPTASRQRLNEVYDAFVKKYKALSDNANKRAFRTDPDAPVLLALEKYDPATKKATKADIFFKNTVRHIPKLDHANDVHEALGSSLHETGGVDVDHMAKLLGQTPEQVGRALVERGIAYQDPGEGWKLADLYLSGNVRRKLTLARAAAAADPKYAPNVAALEKVQPEDIDHEDIDVKLGASWVPPSDVKTFAAHLLGGRPEHFAIDYVPGSGEWLMDFTRDGRWTASSNQATQVWATERKGFREIMEAALNNTSLTVWDAGPDKTRVVNKQATEDANAKVAEMRQAFKDWVWTDDARRDRLHRFYNDNFNNIRNIQYDGSHQSFPGMNPAITLRPHQQNFVWQVVTTGKGLAAHEVGTGKTKSMIAAAMELRRLGLARKPAIACLKANVEQITKEALDTYPGAKILSTADMFDAKKRKETIAKIATGDYDLVLMTHDHLGLLKSRPEIVEKFINDEIKELEAAIVASKEANPKQDNRVVKQLEKSKKNLEAKLQKALEGSKKDNAVFFDETGIDHIFVDEAHKFKTLPVYTKQNRLKGVPTGRSDKATNMQMLTRWLMEQNGGRGVVFATGTPVANTMAELFNMQRYLQPEELKERGIDNFDAWASAFGDVVSKMEFTVAGEYKPVSRFAKFTNIPELMQIVRQVMDVQRADDMRKDDGSPVIVRPKRKDQVIVAEKSPAMERLMKSLQQRARDIKGKAEKGADNMLKICTDGRKGAIDMRLLDANAKDDPKSKVNLAINNILDIHRKNPGVTQLIFSDVGVHALKSAESGGGDGDEIDADVADVAGDVGALAGSSTGFRLYQDIIDKLVAGGIPRDKIADFSQLEGARKEAAMAAMRSGDILVGIGSTEKLGTGVNVQDKLAALHHLDVPWLPASVEQRDGRGWRQGNENKDVGIYRYVSEGSLDQTFWQIIGNKAAFIKQVVTPGHKSARVAKDEDTEELSPEQLMAAASGDPRILRKVSLDEDVKQLRSAESRHQREQSRLKGELGKAEAEIPQREQRIQQMREDAAEVAPHAEAPLVIGGKVYTDFADAEKAFNDRMVELANSPSYYDHPVGSYRGFKIIKQSNGKGPALIAPSGRKYQTGTTFRAVGFMTRQIAKDADKEEADLARHRADVDRLRTQIGKPFTKAEELRKAVEESQQLERELSGKNATPGTLPEAPGVAPASPDQPPPTPEGQLPLSGKGLIREPLEVGGATYENREAIKAAGGVFDGQHWVVPGEMADSLRGIPGLRFGAEAEQAPARSPAGPAEPLPPSPLSEPPPAPITPARKEAIHEALRILAGNDPDRARERNGVGFNQMDSTYGASLAEQTDLTDAQARSAANLLRKYRRQIPESLYATVTTEEEPAAPPPAPVAEPAKPTVKKVRTARGERYVHAFSPGKAFWNVWKARDKPAYLSVRKNQNGDWEASVWGATPEEAQKNVEDLSRRMGVRLSTTVRYRGRTLPAGTRLQPHHLSTLRQRARTGDDDAACLLRLATRLPSSDLTLSSGLSQTARANGIEPRRPAGVRLSTGGNPMADENDDLFDDINDDTEGGADAGDGDNDADDQGGAETPTDIMKDAAAALADKGIIVPDDTDDPIEWIKHLVTACKTHAATNAMGGGEGGEAGEATAESGAAEESPPMLMSLNRHPDPVTRALAARHEEELRVKRLRRIDRLVSAGALRPSVAKELRQEAAQARLSLNRRTGQFAPCAIDQKLKLLERALPANLGLLRHADEMEAPDAEITKAEERQKKLGREMAGVKDD